MKETGVSVDKYSEAHDFSKMLHHHVPTSLAFKKYKMFCL